MLLSHSITTLKSHFDMEMLRFAIHMPHNYRTLLHKVTKNQ